MATAQPPKTVSSVYSPAYFPVESSDSIGFTKVDRIAGTATNLTLAGTVTGIDIHDVNGLSDAFRNIEVSGVQKNNPYPIVSDNIVKPWSDLVCYLAFDDPLNIGRDCTGNDRHGVVKGCTYLSDVTRNHCASFVPIRNANANVEYSNQNHIELSSHASGFAVPEYTISLWYYCTTAVGNNAVFSLADNNNALSHFSILHSTGATRILAYLDSVKVFDITYATTENAWHHVAMTMAPSGNTIYVDGTLLTTYVTGSSSSYFDLSSSSTFFVPNCVSLGATRGPNVAGYPIETQYKFPLNGRISDVTFWSRALSSAEITALQNDDYGYSVFMLCGQSNMVGLGNTTDDSDHDYSLHQNRVYQFDTYNNIRHTTGTISAGNQYALVAPYDVVTNTILQVTDTGVTQNLAHPLDVSTGYGLGTGARVGLWKTFVDDYMQYATIPYRKKLLLLPCAIGSIGFVSHWSPGLPCYEMAKNVAISVLNPGANPLNRFNSLQGFLWNQGEQSIVELDTNFKANWLAMIAGFEASITEFASNLPIVVAETSGNFYDSFVATAPSPDVQMKRLINNSYAELASTYPNITLVKTLGDTQFQTDFKHPDSASYRALGYKYYDAYCESANMANRKNLYDKAIVVNSKMGVRDMIVQAETTFTMPTTLPGIAFSGALPTGWGTLPMTQFFMSKTVTFTIAGGVTGSPTIVYTFMKLGKMVFYRTEGTTITIDTLPALPTISAGQLETELLPVATHWSVVPCRRTVSGIQSSLFASFVWDVTGLISIGDETLDLNNVNTKLSANDVYTFRPSYGFYMTA